MSLNLTGQSHISKVIVLSQASKIPFDVFLEGVPLKARLFRHANAAVSESLHELSGFGFGLRLRAMIRRPF